MKSVLVLVVLMGGCSEDPPTFAEVYCGKLDSCGLQLDWGPGRLLTYEECLEAAAVKWPNVSEECMGDVERLECGEWDGELPESCTSIQ